MRIRQADFALRIVRRKGGSAAIIYRRILDEKFKERLIRLAGISPLAFSAGAPLFRAALRACEGPNARRSTGQYHPLDNDWGARIACYGIISSGLRYPNRIHAASENLRRADGAEAAWWLGLLTRHDNARARRALRILLEAVK